MGVAFRELPVGRSRWRLAQSRDRGLRGSAHCGYCASIVYFRDGDTYLIVASKDGDPRSPGWYHNLKANPDIEIKRRPEAVRGHRQAGAAR
jgi:deazaflavin-dependent oxidoreductase (nitroreductase family)